MTVFAGVAPLPKQNVGKALEDMTVAELRALCEERGIDAPKRAKKAELLELLGA